MFVLLFIFINFFVCIAKKDKNGNLVATLEDFGKMLEWFGPLEKGTAILKRIENQLRMKYVLAV